MLIITKDNIIHTICEDNQDLSYVDLAVYEIKYCKNEDAKYLPKTELPNGITMFTGADISNNPYVTDRPKTQIEILQEQIDLLIMESLNV